MTGSDDEVEQKPQFVAPTGPQTLRREPPLDSEPTIDGSEP